MLNIIKLPEGTYTYLQIFLIKDCMIEMFDDLENIDGFWW